MSSTFVPATGKTGSVLVGTVSYAFKNFNANAETKVIEVSNFNTGAARSYTTGLYGGTLDFEAPYDVGPSGSGGNMTLTLGTQYNFTCNVNSTVSYVYPAIVNKTTLAQEIDGVATLKVNCTINGPFTIIIS